MTVKELIEKLSKLDPDLQVMFEDDGAEFHSFNAVELSVNSPLYADDERDDEQVISLTNY